MKAIENLETEIAVNNEIIDHLLDSTNHSCNNKTNDCNNCENKNLNDVILTKISNIKIENEFLIKKIEILKKI